ncbi:MAG: GDP-mannose 4,6-dehydratase [Lachnospiraceae bacterium]|nr:GDP-mannose 4,6-dehydratase [Lachnospiraceae bacterium]
MSGKDILITGAAGFIGANLCCRLLESAEYSGMRITGLDSVNDYYDPAIKEYRLKKIEEAAERSKSSFRFVKGSIADRQLLHSLFSSNDFAVVVNLAAQAGVRYSIENPDAYMEANVMGFYYVLEECRHSSDEGRKGVEHLVYASSSSIYGSNSSIPYRVEDATEHPVSLYGATKKTDELMAHAYSKLYEIPTTALRFFTVYGPAGRPDMAYFSFTEKLLKGEKIKIFNNGKCRRDFTYVDDVTKAVEAVMKGAPDKRTGDDGLPLPPAAVYNIGNSSPVDLMEFVSILGEELKEAGVLDKSLKLEERLELVPMQPGDVAVTYADTSKLEEDYGFRPSTPLREGIRRFAQWYKEFYA